MKDILGLPVSEKKHSNMYMILEKGKEKYELLSNQYNMNYCELTTLVWLVYVSKYNYANEARVIVEINGKYKLINCDKECNTVEELVDLIRLNNQLVDINQKDIVLKFKNEDYESETEGIIFSFCDDDIEVNINVTDYGIDSNIINEMESKLNLILELLINNVNRLDEYCIISNQDLEYYNAINSNDIDYEIDKPISKLIELQCEKTPNNIAVYYKDIGYTYLEINEKANYLAAQLFKSGISRGDFVPLLMNKSVELIITIYAIMKVGAVFIPIDIKWPEQRVGQVIESTKAKILIVDSEHKVNHYNYWCIEYNKLDRIPNVDYGVAVEDNIYAIFTSGSTGVPKGAINKHKGIANRFLYMNKRYKITEKDVILLTANHAFDSAVWQMFWPLINGNATVIPDTGINFDIISIIKLIEKYKITITDFVPSVFNLLVDFICIKKKYIPYLETLRQLLIGGEEMQANYIYRFKELYPNCSITNTYGPAETSIGTVFYELPNEPIEKIPIGTPIDNVKIYVFDINENLMPIGAIGVLYLGGVCVGSGYVNDNENTNKVFKHIKISDNNCERLYKTGDLVRVNENGELDFYGRIDNQVKINGVRIEIKEIEKAILQHNKVDKCCVVFSNQNNKKILSAFYTSATLLPEESIRKFVSEKLPKAMLPHFYKRLDKIPINSNGKVDVKLLKELEFIC